MDITLAIKLFAALLAIINPLAALPVFLSLTEDRTPKRRVAIAFTAAAAIFITLIVMLFAGEPILRFFSVTVNDFRISGGLLILLMALAMLHAQPSRVHHAPEETEEAQDKENPGVFPLAIPLLAGPGAMTTVIVFSDRAHGFAQMLTAAAVIAIVSMLVFLTLALGSKIGKWLGTTGLNILTRIMGMILAAIAVGMILEGILGSIPALKG